MTCVHRNQFCSDEDGLTALYIVLERFQRQIKPMEAFIDGLKIDFSTRPRRAALKTAFSKSKIEEFRTQLEVSKTGLIASICLTSLLSQ
jgi:imidazoleglycerol phosphate dehydratase HisB